MIVADTNLVSEFMRERPDPGVARWAEGLGASEVGVCVVTVQEIEHGLGRLAAGRRRRELLARWVSVIERFGESILTYDLSAARSTAQVLVRSDQAGRPMSLPDAQIAGICLAAGAELATRNVRDFSHLEGLDLINPFGESVSV